jgi:hypothetical protein
MTTTVTEAARTGIVTNPLAPFPTALGLIAIFLLISLLVEKEFFRAQGSRWAHISQTLDTAIVPLSLAVIYIITVRMLRIMGEL